MSAKGKCSAAISILILVDNRTKVTRLRIQPQQREVRSSNAHQLSLIGRHSSADSDGAMLISGVVFPALTLTSWDKDLGDQLLFGRGRRVVQVVLDCEIVAHLELLPGHNRPHAARCLG